MIGHYLTTALQQTRKAPFTTAANILTLALGLACFIAAVGIATFWMSADTHHRYADRTYIVAQGYQPKGGEAIPVGVASSAAVAKYLAADFPEVERLARAQMSSKTAVSSGERKALFEISYVEPDFLNFFQFDFVAGDPARALVEPGGVVLTQSAAERLFGGAPALGKQVLIGGATQAVVTGVIAPVRQPSFMGEREEALLTFDVLGHWGLSRLTPDLEGEEEWFSAQVLTFARLRPDASLEAVNSRFTAFVDRHMPIQQKELVGVNLEAYPVSEITTRGLDLTLFGSSPLKLSTVSVLIGLGGLILLIACVNYANLATAQAVLTAKQIGLRKVLGASPAEVMTQSWLTSLLQTSVAVLVAMAVLAITAPAVKTATAVDILHFLSFGPVAVLLIAVLVAAVTLAAGAYPALSMSGVQPVRALQSGRSRSGPQLVPRLLVGIQFASAGFLLVLLIVSWTQRNHLEAVALAPRSDPIVVLNEVQSLNIDGEALVAAMRRLPGVKHAAVSERVPWTPNVSLIPLARGPEESSEGRSAFAKHVGHDYFDTLGFKVVAGRVFDREHETQTRSITQPDPTRPIPIVIDETMASALGFATPQAAVGQTVYVPLTVMRIAQGAAAQPAQIIGVTEADTTWLTANVFRGTFYMYGPDSPFRNGLFPILRLERENVRETIAGITRTWDQFSPTTPADVRFFDQMFEDQYRQYDRMEKLFTLLADIALVIAGLGLLGIAVHVAARRRHEIAVRKTLGSTTAEAVWLLLKDFSKPVIIANLIAWPIAYFAAQTYLSAFAQRAPLTPLPFVISLVVTLGIAWLVVAGQTIGAARVSPAQALRDQ